MASRQVGPLLALVIVGVLGIVATVISLETDPNSGRRFDDRSLVDFRSKYDSLTRETAARRASYLSQLIGIGERAELTPEMASHLEEFCRSVLASEEESEVKAQARLALGVLEKRRTQDADAQARGPAFSRKSAASPARGL